MGFAEPRTAVNKEGVIRIDICLRNGFRRSINILVGIAHHEGIESELGIYGRALDFNLFGHALGVRGKIFFTGFGGVNDKIGDVRIAFCECVPYFPCELFARDRLNENFVLCAKDKFAPYDVDGKKRRNKSFVRNRRDRFFEFGKSCFPEYLVTFHFFFSFLSLQLV